MTTKGGATSSVKVGSRASRRPDDAPSGVPPALVGKLTRLDLTTNEARVLLALVRLGSASASEVAREAAIHRTSVYPVLEALSLRGLVAPFSERSAQWASIGRDKILDRLFGAEERRLERLATEKAELRRLFEEVVPEFKADILPGVEFIRGAEQTEEVYLQMLRSARTELLVFNRQPYGLGTVDPSAVVLEMLARGVSTRVLYRSGDLDPVFEQETRSYLDAGLQARVVDDLPTKLVVVDRSAVLVAMMDPVDGGARFPVSQHVEHAGFAATWAAVFEQFWLPASPYGGN